jgi:arylsulfatase A-like enzyme
MKKTIIGVIMCIFVLMLTGCISFPTEKGAGSMSASGEQKPNFVIIMCDDMGYGDWNRGGNPTIRTPNLNKMADEGVQMTQFYSGAPVCSPCRSALLTGRNCIRTGVIPTDRPIDGIDLMPVLEGKTSPERSIYYYAAEHLTAIRKGKWKLHFSYYDHSKGRYAIEKNWVTPKKPLLFDLEIDPSERFNLAGDYPDVVRELTEVAEQYKEEIRRNGENEDLIEWFIKDWKGEILSGLIREITQGKKYQS